MINSNVLMKDLKVESQNKLSNVGRRNNAFYVYF